MDTNGFEPQYDQRIEAWEFSSTLPDGRIYAGSKCPMVLLDSLSLLRAAIDAKDDLIISTPTKESFGQTLATLLALDNQLRKNEGSKFTDIEGLDSRWEPGDRLKMGKATVEFIGYDDKRDGIWIKYDNKYPVKDFLPKSMALVLQRTDSVQPLSPSKTYGRECRLIRDEMGAESDDSDGISELKRKKTYSGETVIYVAALGRAERFFTTATINGSPITDLLLCGRLDAEGRCHPIGVGKHTGTPAIMAAYDMLDVQTYLNTDHAPIDAMIIDVDNMATFVERNTQEIRGAKLAEIPMCAIMSNATALESSALRNEGFQLWRWDKRALPEASALSDEETHEPSFFGNFVQKCKNCSSFSLMRSICEDKDITSLYENLTKLDTCLLESSADLVAGEIKDELWILMIRLMRAVTPFRELSHEFTPDKVSVWKSSIKQRKGFISAETSRLFEESFEMIEAILADHTLNGKSLLVESRIELLSSTRGVVVIARSANEAESMRRFWTERFGENLMSNVVVMPYSAFKAYCAPISQYVVICGWFGRGRMAEIIHNYAFQSVDLLLYKGPETTWSVNQEGYWAKRMADNDDAKKILSSTGISFDRDLPEYPRPRFHLKKEESPIDEIEEKQKERVYRNHAAPPSETRPVVEAVPIRLAGDCVTFFRERSSVVDITRLFYESSAQAKSVRVSDPNGLKDGSLILLRDLDKDVIETIADQYFLKEAAEHKRAVAELWKDSLDKLYELNFGDDSSVYSTLKQRGMNKSVQAMRSWRDETIAPGRSHEDISDTITMIALAAHDAEILDRVEEITVAAEEVQQAHRRAGRKLTSLLEDRLPRYLVENSISKADDIWGPIVVDLGELGEATVYRIIEVEREQKVFVLQSHLGRVFEE